MKPTFAFAFTLGIGLLTLLTGCNIKLDAPILPNLGKRLPEGTSQAEVTKDLTSVSRTQGSTKVFMANLVIDGSLASDLDIDRDSNCAQMTQLTNQAVVVDFYNDVCPANNLIGEPTKLQFTAAYAPMPEERNRYKLKVLGKDIGEMEINTDGTELTLLRLCTGRYDTLCVSSISNRRLSGPPIPLY